MRSPDVKTALLQEIEELAEDGRRQRLSGFDDEALAWLALPPVWPASVARALGVGRRRMERLLEEAVAIGICERREASGEVAGQETRWFVPATRRWEIVDDLRSRGGSGPLGEAASAIGRGILSLAPASGTVDPDPPELPAGLVRWAELAAASSSGGGAADTLRRRVERLVDPRHPAGSRTGEALAWVDSATDLARALGGELESAAIVARRRIELTYRRAQDARHLTHFLERAEQVEAFRSLLSPESARGAWALHYLGMGGVGKTMLIRHIVAELAPEADVLSTRVDFDHLSPHFPARRPGQLLLELTEELRAYSDSSTAEKLFQEFGYRVIELHEALSSGPTAEEPLAALNDPLFERMLHAFCDLLRALGRPVLLILDTCEELAKLHPVGGRIPALDATFEVIERLHAAVPETRVVLAGRRPLARRGAGWELPREEMEGSQGLRAALPESKDYLRLHLIRGFDEDEAVRFLAEVPALSRRPDLMDAVLSRSPDAGTPPGLPTPTDPRPRYNPFDLGLYADWIREDPALDPQLIGTGRLDPYVEIRILRRLESQPAVLALVPAVVLLRRFDTTALRPAFAGDDEAYAAAFLALGEQEWIDYQRDQVLDAPILEVDRNLLPRLDAYFHHPERQHLLHGAGDRLADPLARRLAADPVDTLGVDLVDAALRILPPSRAAAAFHRLTLRVAGGAPWDWAANVGARLLGEDGATGRARSPLRAMVRAFHNAALLHLDPPPDLTAGWQEVEETSSLHPDEDVASWLHWRGRLGRVASAARSGRVDADASVWPDLAERFQDIVAPLDRPSAEQLAVSALAAIEAQVDRWELTLAAEDVPGSGSFGGGQRRRGSRSSTDAVSFLLDEAVRAQLPPEVRGYGLVVAGRAARLGDDDLPPELTLGAMFALVEGDCSGAEEVTASPWMDWAPPRRMRARMLTDLLRLARKGDERDLDPGLDALALSEATAWLLHATRGPWDPETDRLASQALLLRLDHGPVDADTLQALQAWEDFDPEAAPPSPLDRLVPPLFSTLALAWGALGAFREARALLEERRAAAERTRMASDAVDAANATFFALARRFRLSAREARSVTSLVGTVEYGRFVALAEPRRDLEGLPLLDEDDPVERLETSAGSPLLPPRRTAVLHLERAELVALVDPEGALPGLARARDLFAGPAKDPFGAFQASVLGCLAALRAAHAPDARTWADDHVRPAYQRLASTWEESTPPGETPASWPSWDELADPTSPADLRDTFPLQPGWLDRLTACHGATRERSELRKGATDRRGALETYLREVQGGLPIELDVFGEAAPRGGGRRPAPRDALAEIAPVARVRVAVTTTITALLGFGLVTLVFVLAARLLGFSPGIASSLGGGVLTLLGLGVLVTILPVAARAARRVAAWAASLVLSGTRATGTVDALPGRAPSAGDGPAPQSAPSSGSGEGGAARLRLDLTALELPRWWPWRPALALEAEAEIGPDAVDADPRSAAAAAADTPAGTLLPEIRRLLRGRHAHLFLGVDGTLGGTSWEALLAHIEGGDGEEDPTTPALQVHRVGEDSRSRVGSGSRLGGWSRNVDLLVGQRWTAVAEEGWRQGGFSPEEARPSVQPAKSAGRRQTSAAAPRLLHVIAAPVTTVGGTRLRLDLDRDTLGSLVKTSKSSKGRALDEELLAPEDLPIAWLTVIQGEPTLELSLLRTEREQAADLRRFCAGLGDHAPPASRKRGTPQGVRSVLLLPSLPAPLARAALRAFVQALPRRRAPAVERLAQAVARAQRAILAAPLDADGPTGRQTEDPQAAVDRLRRDLALQVTLFHHP